MGNDHRNYFKINPYEIYVAKLGFNLMTPRSAVRCFTDCAMESDLNFQVIFGKCPKILNTLFHTVLV